MGEVTMPENTRRAVITRQTGETRVHLELALDAGGACEITTGVGFLDHMLEQFARHGGFGLKVSCVGDLHVDDHHSVEDVGICLGTAVRQALGDCAGIARYGDAIVPMDESLALCAVDVSGRGLSVVDLEIATERIGTFACELVPEFVRALATHGGLTIHIRRITGQNRHHLVEAAFKALGRALGSAVAVVDPGGAVPSTKGLL